jgi:hypothetical protein
MMQRAKGEKMRRLLLVLTVAATVFLVCPRLAIGCGDKFVVLGRGMRLLNVKASAHPASILIYMNRASRVAAAEREFQLQSTLKQAGHKPSVVDDQRALDKALTSGKYDLVLADLSDAAALEKEAQGSHSKPAVIPVVYNPTGAELSAAEKQYSCVAQASKTNHELLAVIDEAMVSKSKGAAPTCQKKTK